MGQAGVLSSGLRPIPWATMRAYIRSTEFCQLLNDPELDVLLDSIMAEPDTAKRQDNIQKMMEIVANSYVALNIAYSNNLMALSDRVGQFPSVLGWNGRGLSYELATHAAK